MPQPPAETPAADNAGREEMLRDLEEVVRQILKEVEAGTPKPDEDE